MLSKKEQLIKRLFDLILTLILLPLLIIPLFLLWLMAGIDMRKNGLYKQERIGRHGKPFMLYKLRTLRGTGHVTIHDIRQKETFFGRWLRRTKLDELPQLFNILKGDMSWVGPRPDLPGYADRLEDNDRVILSLRPGLTGPATLKYRNEDALLMSQTDPLSFNDGVIWPDKVAINKAYIKEWSLAGDINFIIKSIF